MAAASPVRSLGAVLALLALPWLSAAAPPAAPVDSLLRWPEDWRCGYLRRIAVTTDNVFLPEEPSGRSFYARLTNALHSTTNPSVVRRGLHLRRGDRVCRADIEAGLRNLRSYDFLHSEVRMRLEADGDSVDLAVRTRDVWSTRPTLKVGKEGSLWSWTARLSETNLLGRGKELALAIGRDEQQAFWGWGYGDRQLLGGPMRLELGMTRGSELRGEKLRLAREFVRPATPWGLRLEADRYRGRVTDRRGGVEGPEWDRDSWLVSGWAGPRALSDARRALRLMPGVYLDRERYPSAPETTASPSAACARTRAGEPLRARDRRAAGLMVSGVIESYERRRVVDLLGTWEDIPLGSHLDLFVGYSPRRWGALRDAGHTRLRFQQGLRLGAGAFALLSAQGSGDWTRAGATDAWLTLLLRGYAALSPRQTLAMRWEGNLTRDLAPQDLPTLGAEHGLRGFDAYRFWGEGAWGASLEDRVLLAEDLFDLVALGAVIFVDAGSTWIDDCRTAARGRACAGAGLRLQGSRTSGRFVTRLDLGYPLAGAQDDEGWVLSVALGQAF